MINDNEHTDLQKLNSCLQAFEQLQDKLAVRDYDDEIFLHGLPENEPVSLVIPFERDNAGYMDIFREYIGGQEHPELSDRDLLKNYLQHQGKSDAIFSDVSTYTPQFFRGYIEESESQTDTRQTHIDRIEDNIRQDIEGYDGLSRFEQRSIREKYFKEYWRHYTPKTTLSKEEQLGLVQKLNEMGIYACTEYSPQSAETSSLVVMPNGILTPFMTVKDAKKILPVLKAQMKQYKMTVGGHIAPVSFEQLRQPQTNKEEQTQQKLEAYQALAVDFKQRNASNLYSELLNDDNSLFRGGILGTQGFIANIDCNPKVPHCLRKSYAMATRNAGYAMRYACLGGLLDGKSSDKAYGLLYQYTRSGDEFYFADRGIERCPTTAPLPDTEGIETPVFPAKHKLKDIYFVSKYLDDKQNPVCEVFRLDMNNPLHKHFLELHNSEDSRLTGYLKERRIKQFREAAANFEKPVCHKYKNYFKGEENMRGVTLELNPETGELEAVPVTEESNEEKGFGAKNDILLSRENDKQPQKKFNFETGESYYADERLQKIAELRKRLYTENNDPLAARQRLLENGLEEIGLSKDDLGKTGDSRSGEVSDKHKKVAESQTEDAKWSILQAKQQRGG